MPEWDDPFQAIGSTAAGGPSGCNSDSLGQDSSNKRVFGGDTSVKNLAPYKYPWALKLWRGELSNSWTPEEVNMTPDLLDYRRLSDDDRTLFFTMLSTLTTTDIAVAENAAVSLYSHVSAPEIQLYIGRQIGTETLHSVSYQHILEGLGLPQEEVYSLYRRVPEIYQKFQLAQEYSLLLKNADNVQDILAGFFFWSQMVEGMSFMAGFASLMSFPRRNLMRSTGSQIIYIHRDEQLHVSFGLQLIREALREGARLDVDRLVGITRQAVEAESVFAHACLPTVLGYNARSHVQYCQHLADSRLTALGLAPLWDAPDPFPWLSELLLVNKERNFFETRVTEYQSGGLVF
jgi:ribonucleoside-diphosphate reductase beta chain